MITAEQLKKLSAREREVALLLCSGARVGVVARRLFRSPKTITTHKRRIRDKLGLMTKEAWHQFVAQPEISHGG
jgi:two-component system, NarL family, invasion response regulator UvrY